MKADGPRIPTPPPLPSAQLSAVDQNALNVLKQQVTELKQGIANGEQSALQAYQALRKKQEDLFSQHQRSQVIPLRQAKQAKDQETKDLALALKDKKNAIETQVKLLSQAIVTYEAQIKKLLGWQARGLKVEADLVKAHHQIDDLLHKQQALKEESIQNEKEYQDNVEQAKQEYQALTQKYNQAIAQSIPFKAKLDAIPKLKSAHQENRVAARNINLKEWYDQGIINGLFMDNLRKFVLINSDELAHAQEIYPDHKVLSIYQNLATHPVYGDPHFNEYLILGIAVEQITRDYDQGAYCTSQQFSNRFLNNTIKNQERSPILQALLEELYQKFPLLAESTGLEINVQGKIDGLAIDQISARIDEVLAITNTSPQRSGQSARSSSSHQANRSENAHQLNSFAHLEQRREEVEKLAKENHKEIYKNLAKMENHQQQFNQLLSESSTFLNMMDLQLLNLMLDEMETAPELDHNIRLKQATEGIRELKNQNEQLKQQAQRTPVEVLQIKLGEKSNVAQAAQAAIETHWNQHHQLPDRNTILTWVKSAGVKGTKFSDVNTNVNSWIKEAENKHQPKP